MTGGGIDRLEWSLKTAVKPRDFFRYPAENTVVFRWPNRGSQYARFKRDKNLIKHLYGFQNEGEDDFYVTAKSLLEYKEKRIIAGSLWDSTIHNGNINYWNGIVKFCKENRIEIITNYEAYKKVCT